MNLTGKQKNYLRGVAHSMNPIVMIGAKGLTEAVLNEIELALDQHELIKIKLPSNSKAEKAALIAQITRTVSQCKSLDELVFCTELLKTQKSPCQVSRLAL